MSKYAYSTRAIPLVDIYPWVIITEVGKDDYVSMLINKFIIVKNWGVIYKLIADYLNCGITIYLQKMMIEILILKFATKPHIMQFFTCF